MGMELPPRPLVSPAWLAERLGEPGLVVLDTTAHLDPPGDPGRPYDVRSGRADWQRTHIAGSRFADIPGELSDLAAPYPFTLPAPERFAAAIGRLGIGDETLAVAYDDDGGMWASRLWWMLRVFGHDRAAVLDGGLGAWREEGRPLTDTQEPDPTPATFTPRLRPALVADRDDVVRALDDPAVLLLNALAPEAHRGETNRYGRPGRIPGSVNVPARALVDSDGRFRSESELREELDAVGAVAAPHVVAYCGGGISATRDALALALLGRDDVAVYDGSLREWTADPDLPLETG
jgi:thiosulfate/3-mercaptopyruvate sulfurtransferase